MKGSGIMIHVSRFSRVSPLWRISFHFFFGRKDSTLPPVSCYRSSPRSARHLRCFYLARSLAFFTSPLLDGNWRHVDFFCNAGISIYPLAVHSGISSQDRPCILLFHTLRQDILIEEMCASKHSGFFHPPSCEVDW